jgi:hypothetical protein
MFDNLHNPIFAGGVILAGIVATIILWQVIVAIGKAFFWKPKKRPDYDSRVRHLTGYELRQRSSFAKRHQEGAKGNTLVKPPVSGWGDYSTLNDEYKKPSKTQN